MPTTELIIKKTMSYRLKLSIVTLILILMTLAVFKMYSNQQTKNTNNTSNPVARNYFLVPGILSSLLFIHQTGAHPSSSN